MNERVAQTLRIEVDPARVKVAPAAPTTRRAPVVPHEREFAYLRLLESIYDGVLITDWDGTVVDFNRRVYDHFRFAEDHPLPWGNVLQFICGAEAGLIDSMRENLRGEQYFLIEAFCRRGDGSIFPAEIAVNRIELPDERNLCFLIRDVSLRKQAQEALENAVLKLEAHDRARSDFVDNVSHELRTPLTSMLYAISNMLKGVVGELPQRVRYYVEMLDGDCRRLWSTINDILDTSRLDQGRLTLLRARVPLCPLVERTVKALRVQADLKSQKLEVACGATARFVDCDAAKIERVILNIVSNALKYTPEGGRISVRVEDGATEGMVAVAVEDDGIGIPAESIQRVMERYYRVGEHISGSGLGLPISKELVELHGGRLLLASPPPGRDHGTLAQVILPAVEGPAVLVAEPDDALREELVALLRGLGCRPIAAGTAALALEHLRAQRPALALLSLQMPDSDGHGFVLQAQGGGGAKLPIIATTDRELDPARREVLVHFTLSVLRKPWQKEAVVEAVTNAFLGKGTFGR